MKRGSLTKKQKKYWSASLWRQCFQLFCILYLWKIRIWSTAVPDSPAVIGCDILVKAVLGIMHGEVFDENFLMAVATVGAMGLGEYSEGVAVMLFYQIW